MSVLTEQENAVYILSDDSISMTFGPTFSISTAGDGCNMALTALVSDDEIGWDEWNTEMFDFMVPCSGCSGPESTEVLNNGQIMVNKPADITPYKPYKSFTFKITATDEIGAGNSITQSFELQLRDLCADDFLI